MHHNHYSFFIIVFIIYTISNFYIFYRIKQVLPKSKFIRTVFYITFSFFYLAFIIAMLGRNIIPVTIQKMIYFPGTVWMGMMLYLIMYFLITDFLYYLFRFLRIISSKKAKYFRKIQVLSGSIFVICIIIYGNYQFRRPAIVEKTIKINKQAGDYKHLKVVGVSDLHLGVAIDKKRLEKFVSLINDQHPDLIIIAGDVIDNNTFSLEKERMWETLNKLEAPLGTFYCLGNHEYMIGIDASMNFLCKTNFILLIDKSITINNSLQIIGRDDFQRNSKRKSLKEIIKDIDTTLPLILIDHEPFKLKEAEENGIDLHFCGHTHQGQIFPFNLFINRMYELSYGYLKRGKTHHYVTSGLGLWGPPLRVGTKSEIIVFNIEFY